MTNKPIFWPEDEESEDKKLDRADRTLENYRRASEAQRDIELIKAKRKGLDIDTSFHMPRDLMIRSLDSVEMKAIDWLWQGWIPRGYITIWAGETGAGKSTVLADVTARVSKGAPWPGEPLDQPRPCGRVLWLGSEDGIEELTVPRLVACSADLANVHEIQGVMQGGARNTFSMQDDIKSVRNVLEDAIKNESAFVMLVIDPITSYLPGRKLRKVDLNDAGQLRSILEPWLGIAQEYNLAIVCVTHFMKDTTRAMLHRVLGSAAFAQTCRSLCSVVSRSNEGMYAKTLIQVKVNLPDHPGGAWKFHTVKVRVATDTRSGKSIYATRPEWEALDPDITPESLVGGTRGPVSKYTGSFGVWLRAYFMTTPEESQQVSEVKDAAIKAGVASARWWDDHSGDYLDKQNRGGIWWCRLKA